MIPTKTLPSRPKILQRDFSNGVVSLVQGVPQIDPTATRIRGEHRDEEEAAG